MPRWFVLLLVITSALVASSARADRTPEEDARIHYEAGRMHYEEGRYEAARTEFEAAFQRSERPELLYNIAQCWSRLGDDGKTVEYLRRYLQAAPNAGDRAAVERWIQNLERSKPPATATTTAPPAAAPETSHTATWILLGSAAALAGGGAVLGALASSRYGDLEDGCGAAPGGCAESEIDGVKGRALAANLLFGGAVVAGAVALVLYLTGSGDAPVAMSPSASGGAVAWAF